MDLGRSRLLVPVLLLSASLLPGLPPVAGGVSPLHTTVRMVGEPQANVEPSTTSASSMTPSADSVSGSEEAITCTLPEAAEPPGDSSVMWPATSSETTTFGTQQLNDVTFTTSAKGYVVGFHSTVRMTRDGGTTWSDIAPHGVGQYEAIEFVDQSRGWLAGRQPVIHATGDGGVTWTACVLGDTTAWYFYDIEFTSDVTGWIGGWDSSAKVPLLFETNDGGATWVRRRLEGITGYIASIRFAADGLVGYIAGSTGAMRTLDGGRTWDASTLGKEAVTVVPLTATTALAGTRTGVLYRTDDAGGTWVETAQLGSVLADLDELGGTYFVASDNGRYAYSRDGTSWIKRGTASGSAYLAIHPLGPDRAVVAGTQGTVARVTLTPLSPPAPTTRYYFTPGETELSPGGFGTAAPTETASHRKVDVPSQQNTAPEQTHDPVWRGQIDGTIDSIEIEFWRTMAMDGTFIGPGYVITVWIGRGPRAERHSFQVASGRQPVRTDGTRMVGRLDGFQIDPEGAEVSISIRPSSVYQEGMVIHYGSQGRPSGFTINPGAPPPPPPSGAGCAEGGAGAVVPGQGPGGPYPEVPNDALFDCQWGLHAIRAPQAWQQRDATGDGIMVAVLDSGVDLDHPDLACFDDKLGPGYDFSSQPNDDDADVDRGGPAHGTHVAGIIAACANDGTGIAGVAPDATILPYRTISAVDDVLDMATAIRRAADDGAHVINMSFSSMFHPAGYVTALPFSAVHPINDAIEYATAKGVVVVAAAGNAGAFPSHGFGPAGERFPWCAHPALSEEAICVAAVGRDHQLATYSNSADKFIPGRSPHVIAAPGGDGNCNDPQQAILSLIIDGADDGCGLPHGYGAWNGTSMASPHVAGAAALLYDRLGGERAPCPPGRDIDTAPCAVDLIREALFSTTADLGAPGLDTTYGWGLVDAEAAVRSIPVPEATTITFATETFVATYGDGADIGLILSDRSGRPLADRDVQLSFGAKDAAVVVSATTDGAGFARVRVPATLEPGPYDLTARFVGEPGLYDPATATAGLTVERESTSTSLEVTGRGVNRRLIATLTEDDGPALADQVVSFYADGVAIGSGVTDRDGRISFQPPERYRADHVTFEAVFAGTPRYAPSSASHRT